ncbi:MAG: hypothetical protein ACRCY3_03070 [Sphingorhabdus sp.]
MNNFKKIALAGAASSKVIALTALSVGVVSPAYATPQVLGFCVADADTGQFDCGIQAGVGTKPNATSIGNESAALGENSTALGQRARATADDTTAIGREARALVIGSTAVGRAAWAQNINATAIGNISTADGVESIAIGADSFAQGSQSSAVGTHSDVRAVNGSAFGYQAEVATGADGGMALGALSQTAAAFGTAVGTSSRSLASSATALGYGAKADGASTLALGAFAQATDLHGIAVGAGSKSQGDDAVAMGFSASALASGALAVGHNATADQEGVALGTNTEAAKYAVAIGRAARATHSQSIAIGYGAFTKDSNEIVLGGAYTSVRLPGIDTSNAEQDAATITIATIDKNGLLGRSAVSLSSIGGAGFDPTDINNAIGALQASQTLQDSEIQELKAGHLVQEGLVSGLQGQAGVLLNSDAAQNTRLDALEMLGGGGGAVDLAPLIGRVDGHDALLASIQTGQAAQDAAIAALQAGGGGGGGGGAPVDLAPVNARVDAVEAVNVVQDGQIAALQTQQAETATTVAEHTTQIASVQQAQMMTASQVAQQGVSIANMQTGMQALNSQLAGMSSRMDSLEGRIMQNEKALRQNVGGIAAVAALGGTTIVPDSRLSVNFNLATYRGEQGFSGTVAFQVTPKVYVTGGIAGSTVKGSTTGRVGVAIGF